MLYFACVSKAILAFFCTFFGTFWGLFLVPKSSKIEMGPFGTCFLEAKEGQEVLQGRFLTLPRRSTGFPRGSREPKRVQEGSQDAPKRFPRGSQEAPKRFQERSGWLPKAPKTVPKAPKMCPRRSKTGLLEFNTGFVDFKTGLLDFTAELCDSWTSRLDFELQDGTGLHCNISKDFGGRLQAWG